jgi:creatinine amidohydrolase
VRAAVVEACRALVELGAKRIVLMTFHGSPLHAWALEAGVRAAVRLGAQAISPLNIVLEELLADGVGERFAAAFAHVPDAAERDGMMRGLARDFHAGFFETSLALHYAPATVSQAYHQLPPCADVTPDGAMQAAARVARTLGRERLSRELQLAADGTGWKKLRPFPGYTGRPHRATAEAGAVFARAIVDRYEGLAREVFAGRARSPAPILGWVVPATLGGRIAA